jgi:glycosyltransferase involved in cell wall biosynthesis
MISWPFIVCDKNFFIEKIGRFFCCFFTFIFLKFNKFDLIHTNDFSFIYFLSFLPKFLRPKIKIIFESHKIYFKTSKKVSRKQEKRAYKLVDSFISVSSNCKKDLINFFQIKEENIKVLPSPVNVSYFDSFNIFRRDDVDIFWNDKNCLKVIYSGSFIDWKGVDVLINSLENLNKNVKVLIFGGDKSDLDRFKLEIKRQIDGGSLMILEKLDRRNMTNLLLKADIGVLANNFDENNRYTSPMKIPEYMASGLSIVAPDVLKHSDFFEDNLGVVFFKTCDHLGLAKKINYLEENREVMRRLSQENINKKTKFDIEKRVSDLLIFFNKKIKNEKN